MRWGLLGYKWAGLEAGTGFTEGAVKPYSQGPRHFQPIHGFFVLGTELVSGFVAFNPQDMEQFFDLRFQAQFPVQAIKQFGLAGLFVKLNTGQRGQVLGQGFAKLAEFDQVVLGSLAKARSADSASSMNSESCSARNPKFAEWLLLPCTACSRY